LFVTYLRIPGTPEMSQTMDIHLSEAVTGQISAKEALDRTYADWQRIVEDQGKDNLLKLYQTSIGYTPQ
jgi:multiple sugar transport system substrate-binding protein